jgi:hypothetical protein
MMRRADVLVAAVAALAVATGDARGDASVVLRWKPVEDALAYDVEIGADPELSQPLVRERVAAPGYRWRELPEARCYWRVRGVDARGRAGRWSEVRALEPVLLPPEPRAPAEGTVVAPNEQVELACAPSRAAQEYELEVVSDPEDAGRVERRRGAAPRFRLALPAGHYRWRMRATSREGVTTRWSPMRRLSVRKNAPAAAVEAAPSSVPDPNPGAVAAETARLEPAALESATLDTVALESPPAAPEPTVVGAAPPPSDAVPLEPQPSPGSPSPPAPAGGEGRGEGAVYATAPDGPERSRVRLGLRLGWHTTFCGISSPAPGLAVDFLLPFLKERLVVSLRAAYYAAAASVPIAVGLPAGASAAAHVVPLGAAALYEHPLAFGRVYGGVGAQAQVVHVANGRAERIDLVPAANVLAGVARRLRSSEVFAESGYASGSLDAPIARLRTGGLHVAVGWRFAR